MDNINKWRVLSCNIISICIGICFCIKEGMKGVNIVEINIIVNLKNVK